MPSLRHENSRRRARRRHSAFAWRAASPMVERAVGAKAYRYWIPPRIGMATPSRLRSANLGQVQPTIDIREATRGYERWLGARMRLVTADLRLKHREMSRAEFPFLRATFYRWCQLWQKLAVGERRAPAVLAVGDLHIENFGTWRDAEGRLVWGINDFDEAAILPWSQDLVRLAASAHVAITSEHLAIKRREACEAIL